MVTRDEENNREERESRRDRRRAERNARKEEKTEERTPPPRRPEPPHEGRGLAAWGPRLLAPLAFFLAATILILLVSSALDHKKKESTSTVPQTPTNLATQPTGTGTAGGGAPKRTFYVVKSGDTLESIAAKKNT